MTLHEQQAMERPCHLLPHWEAGELPSEHLPCLPACLLRSIESDVAD